MESHKGNQGLDVNGVPSFAKPWIQLGRLEERETWHILAMKLMETCIKHEIRDIKDTLSAIHPSHIVQDVKEKINSNVISRAEDNICHLIGLPRF